jgi:hypothetical protein
LKENPKGERDKKVSPLDLQHVRRDKSGCKPLRILFTTIAALEEMTSRRRVEKPRAKNE